MPDAVSTRHTAFIVEVEKALKHLQFAEKEEKMKIFWLHVFKNISLGMDIYRKKFILNFNDFSSIWVLNWIKTLTS